MASDASEARGLRIAKSIHDRAIQPYDGLQIGLIALQGLLESQLDRLREATPKFSEA